MSFLIWWPLRFTGNRAICREQKNIEKSQKKILFAIAGYVR